MNQSQFVEALDRYGSDLRLWPAAGRKAAQALLEHSPEAQAAQASAAMVERFIRANDPAQAVDRNSVRRVSNAVMAALPLHPQVKPGLWPRLAHALGLGAQAIEWLPRFAVSTAAAAVLGLVLGQQLTTNNSNTTRTMSTEMLAMSSSYLPLDIQ